MASTSQTDLLAQMQALLKSKDLSSKNIVTSSSADIASSLGSTESNFGSSSAKDDTLGGTKSEVADAKTTTDSNYKNLSQGVTGKSSMSAVNTPVTFVTSTDQKAIDNPDVASVSNNIDFRTYTDEEMAKIREITGEENPTEKDASEGLFTWNSGLLKNSASKNATLKNSMEGEDKGFLSSVSDYSKSAQTATSSKNVSKLAQDNLDFLPPNVRSTVGGVAGNASGKLSNKIGVLNNKAGAISGFATSAGAVLGIGGDYPEGQTANGESAGYFGSDADYKDIDNMYRSSKAVCSGIGNPLNEYSNMKELFDVLYDACMRSGMANLARQLMDCSEGKWVDGRTSSLAYQGSYTAAKRGDPYTLNTAASLRGTSGISNPKNLARTTGYSMDYNEDNSNEFDSFLGSNGLTRSSLYEDDRRAGTISSQQVVASSQRNTKLSDSALGKDTTKTALKIFDFFG